VHPTFGVRRLAVAALLCGSLELASMATVVAIARSAPARPASSTPALSNCVRFVIGGTPVLRCPGG
jgi:hypothetical protein